MRTTRPLDLAAALALALAGAGAAFLAAPAWLRVPLGLALVLVLPGYAFVAALFPERHRPAAGEVGRRGLEPLERLALSLGLSIAIVPLLGLALNYTPLGIRLVPVLALVLAFTVACLGLAAWRRLRLPEDERLVVSLQAPRLAWRGRAPLDRALSLALVAAALFAAGSLVYVLTAPRAAEPFTEVYILGPTGKLACYPSTFRDGRYLPAAGDVSGGCPADAGNVTVGIVNHEGRDVTYWLRVLWTQERALPGNRTAVTAVREVLSESVTLPSRPVDLSLNASFQPQHEQGLSLPAPPFTGTARLSIQVYLERPDPATPSPGLLESPYRRLHLFIAS